MAKAKKKATSKTAANPGKTKKASKKVEGTKTGEPTESKPSADIWTPPNPPIEDDGRTQKKETEVSSFITTPPRPRPIKAT